MVPFELDWLRPPSRRDLEAVLVGVDLVLVADAVWVEALVGPLVRALRLVVDCIASANPAAARPPSVYLAHQTRSTATDERLWAELARSAFAARALPEERLHPDFRAPGVIVVYQVVPA